VQYDRIEKEIIKLMQADLPLESRPYKGLSKALGVSEEEIVARINDMKERGLIKRLGAVLRHQKVGYTVNAMVVWKLDEKSADKAGKIMAECSQISHCYLRKVPEDFGYNLFSMIHCKSQEELFRIIDSISKKTGLNDYLVIRSVREMKKVSMSYI